MKKPIIITVTICVVIILIALFIARFTSINKDKIAISAYDFQNNMESKGYIINDASE